MEYIIETIERNGNFENDAEAKLNHRIDVILW